MGEWGTIQFRQFVEKFHSNDYDIKYAIQDSK